MTDVALVLCSGTLPAATPLLERIEVAAQAGFDGLSLWGRDHEAAIAGGSTDEALRSAFATAGIGVAEVDGAWGWTPGAPALGRGIDPFLDHDEASLFAIAEGLGGRSVNAVDIFGGDGTLAEMATAFGSLCDRAADHGLLVHLEALPWSRVPTVREAMAVVELSLIHI